MGSVQLTYLGKVTGLDPISRVISNSWSMKIPYFYAKKGLSGSFPARGLRLSGLLGPIFCLGFTIFRTWNIGK